MQVLVPFDARQPKSRLADVLADDERLAFARAMLEDVLDALTEAGHAPRVLSTAPFDTGVPVTVDKRPLTDAVNHALCKQGTPVGVVMADLALATPAALERLFETASDVVVAPGLGGGTNALVIRQPEFRVDYHGTSVRDHRDAATGIEASVAEVDSYRLGVDIDDPADLVEVLLHGRGRAADWLVDAGFSLEQRAGRTTVSRADSASEHV